MINEYIGHTPTEYIGHTPTKSITYKKKDFYLHILQF